MPLWHLPIHEGAGGFAPQPFLAPRGWHRLAIATTCCNDHILTRVLFPDSDSLVTT